MRSQVSEEPLVSIVTPVYNGERFLDACIDSVLAQHYQNWEYIIVNNCSTDRTLDIARSYAARDSRIRIHCNTEFVNADANHNIAFRQISRASKYCKVVSADDWLEPQCISRLVEIAQMHPSAGIVGSYQRSGNAVRWRGLPTDVTFIAGREIARRSLLRELNVLGTPTSVIYRADLVRKREGFFPHTRPHADTSACYELLRESDFSFVHEVLSHERLHEGQVSTEINYFNAGIAAHLELLQRYGSSCFDSEELQALMTAWLRRYYRLLGGCVLKLRGIDFWRFHASRLRELGFELSVRRIIFEALKECVTELRHPIVSQRKFANALRELLRR